MSWVALPRPAPACWQQGSGGTSWEPLGEESLPVVMEVEVAEALTETQLPAGNGPRHAGL